MLKKIELAKTGIMVSEMSLGCLGFGTKNDEKNSYALLDRFVERGGNFLDTSNNYVFWGDGNKGGESETLLGKWMKERVNRDNIVLATKCGAFPANRDELLRTSGSRQGWIDNCEGLSAKAIIEAAEKSLKRLKTDRIDLYYAHIDHRPSLQEESLKAYDSLVSSGKVREIGCSNFKTWRVERFRRMAAEKGLPVFTAVQQFHSYLQPKPETENGIQEFVTPDLLDYSRENPDVQVLAYTPLLWGSYVKKDNFDSIPFLKFYKTRQNEEKMKALEVLSSETGATVNQLVYYWMMRGNPRIIPLVAVSRLEHLEENLEAAALVLNDKQREHLYNAGL